MSESGGNEKACLKVTDSKSSQDNTDFFFQFNPKEISLVESMTWKQDESSHSPFPNLTFDKGAARAISFEVFFDTTDTGDSVEETWVAKLRSFMSANVAYSENDSDIRRPPHLKFIWKDLKYECVLDNCETTYLMFKRDGTPLRAKCSVSLMGRKHEMGDTVGGSSISLPSADSMVVTGAANEVRVVESNNKNMSQIAQEENAPLDDMAKANNTDDPMEPQQGPTVVPGSSEMANVMESQNQATVPSNTSNKSSPSAFGGSSDSGGGSGDSAMDDPADLGVQVKGGS